MLTGGYHLDILSRKNIHHVQSVYNAKIIYVRSRVHYTVFMYALRRYTRLAQGYICSIVICSISYTFTYVIISIPFREHDINALYVSLRFSSKVLG